MLYLIIIIILIALIVKFDLKENLSTKAIKQRNIWINVILVIFVLLAGLGAVGGDFPGYYQEYKITPEIDKLTSYYIKSNSYYRPAWLIYFSFCKTISNNYIFFHLVHALFVNVVIFKFIKKNTEFVFLAVSFYFILNYLEFNFESIRETMAISFVLLGLNYLNKQNWYIFFVFALIAIGFHESAIISLLIPFLIKIKKVNVFRLTLSLLVITAMVTYINNYAQISSLIEIEAIRNKIEGFYIYLDFEVKYSLNYWIIAIPKILVPLIALYVVSKHSDNKYYYAGIIIFIIVLNILYAISFSKYFSRLANYFAPFYWVLLSQWMVLLYRKTRKKIAFPTLFVTTVLILSLLLYQHSQFGRIEGSKDYWYSRYYPYISIFTYENR